MRPVCLLIALIVMTGTGGYARQAPSATLDAVRAHREGLAVWWTGNAGWLIKAGDRLIGIDLDLSLPQKVQPPPVTAEALAAELDVAFVSHHHGDHCNTSTLRALAPSVPASTTTALRTARTGVPGRAKTSWPAWTCVPRSLPNRATALP